MEEYRDGVQESLDTIFASILVAGIDRENTGLIVEKKKVYKTCLSRFLATFSCNVFENEYAFLYLMIKKLKIKTFTLNMMNSVVDQNVNEILNSPLIDMGRWENTLDNRRATDEEKIEAFKYELGSLVTRLSNLLVVEDEFESACELYIQYYKDKHILDTVQNMALIMSGDGFLYRKSSKRKIKLQGREDAQKYYNEQLSVIKSLEEENAVKGVLIDGDYFREDIEKEKTIDDDIIIDFGIAELDEAIGKLRRTELIEFMGPPKGGKTTITTFIVERCLEAGLNVAIWALEGTKDEWIALLTALMVRKENSMYISKKKVMFRNYESDKHRQAIVAAKKMLMCSPDRGKLSFIEGTAYVEDFVDDLQNHYDNINPFDVIVIDSPINMLSRTGKGKVERISEAYMLYKDFIANKLKRKALGIATAQLKQSTIDIIRKNPDETLDVTAGGESAETVRSPDEVIGLFSTKNERKLGQMKLYHIASRHNETFDDFYVGCELGCGYFFSNPSLNE